jgi:predicted Zn-ribbon and HTH transcriptional regulator
MKCLCKRCTYEWETKTIKKPKCCPYCKSYQWDKEKEG